MDRLTTIETALADLIKTIQVPVTPTSGAYNYYTSTGQVNIEDEVLALAQNTNNKMVNYTIYLNEPEQNLEWSIGQNAYTNQIVFRIEARVHLVGTEGNPKFQINQKMNEVVSDFKYLLYKNHTLGGKCNFIRYDRSERMYNDSNNRIMTADVILYVVVNYSQSGSNPDLPICF